MVAKFDRKAYMKKYNAEYKRKNIKKATEYNLMYKKVNKKRIKEDRAEYQEKNKYKISQQLRARKLKNRYGITIAEYNLLFGAQDGCCAICNEQTQYPKKLIDLFEG